MFFCKKFVNMRSTRMAGAFFYLETRTTEYKWPLSLFKDTKVYHVVKREFDGHIDWRDIQVVRDRNSHEVVPKPTDFDIIAEFMSRIELLDLLRIVNKELKGRING